MEKEEIIFLKLRSTQNKIHWVTERKAVPDILGQVYSEGNKF